MKYTLLVLLVLVISFSGCEPKEKEKPEQKSEIQTEEKRAVRNEEAENEKNVIAEAETVLYDKSESRIENIKLAAAALDGHLTEAGETFSFNEAVGERTEERGYKKAPVLHYEETEYDYGGGVCQLSTTLYQAAKKAGFEIAERSSHKKEVNYAEKGEDAAVDYGSLDLKFVNNTDYAVAICTGVYEESVIVQLVR